MKRVWNTLLGLGFALCLWLLVFQGFAAPSLSEIQNALLRFAAAFFLQWLLLRVGKNVWIRSLPLAAVGILAVWGFFLFLTSPSWQNATLWHYLADYATPLLGAVTAGGICAKFGK